MKLEEYIKEEWKDSVKRGATTYDIFKNPTKKEINDLIEKTESIRYIIDGENKAFYIFNFELLHTWIAKHLKIPYKTENGTRIFGAIGFPKKGSKLHIDKHDKLFFNNFLRKYGEEGSNWIWKYFDKEVVLKEEWKDTVKMYRRKSISSMKNVDVFVNPTTKEMLEAEDKLCLRFIANFSDKKVYVFNPDVTHQEMAMKLNLSKSLDDYRYDTKLLGGVAKISGGKFKIIEIHNLDIIGSHEHKLARSRRDWSFINKYIIASDFIEKRRKALEKEENIKKARRKIREQYEL